MRDVGFSASVLARFRRRGLLDSGNSILAVCAGQPDKKLFESGGYRNVTISNLDSRESAEQYLPYEWNRQDAHDLTYADKSFDWTFVSDGLHHCHSPHQALTEMYRVARRGVILFESRDSLLVRLSARAGVTLEHEVSAVADHYRRWGVAKYGGLDSGDIPNYVYRWTERELVKAVQTCDPTGPQRWEFFYRFSRPARSAGLRRPLGQRALIVVSSAVISLLTKVFRKQCNSFGAVVLKPRVPDDLWPWLELQDGEVHFKTSIVDSRGRADYASLLSRARRLRRKLRSQRR